MNWEAVGAIGEVVGAMGIIVTLAYLAYQIRQNTQGMRLTARQTLTHQNTEYTKLLLCLIRTEQHEFLYSPILYTA